MIVVLFVAKSNTALPNKDEHASLYVASYISGPWSPWSQSGNYSTTEGIIEGNIVLVNPTSTSLSNLKLAIQVDNSETFNSSLRVWDSNYTLDTPNSFLQSEQLFEDMQNFSTPITSISIDSNQRETISLVFSSPETFQFGEHSLRIYVSKNNFGDIVNGQLLIVPQTEAYLQIVNFSVVESDIGTYHQYYDSAQKSNMVTVAYNPNFYQRYLNTSKYDIYADNFAMMHDIALDYSYRNVTVFNNNTFPVNSVIVFGQEPYRSGALMDYAIQPSETYLFPVSDDVLPAYAYVIGYVTNNSAPASTSPTPTVSEFSWLMIVLALLGTATFALVFRYKEKEPNTYCKIERWRKHGQKVKSILK